MLDEDEWTDRNFGNSVLNNHKSKSKASGGAGLESSTKASENGDDTSEDSISDIDTDSDDEDDDDDDDDDLDLDDHGDGPASRPLTADEARQLQKEWIKKYAPGSDSEEESKYDNVRRHR